MARVRRRAPVEARHDREDMRYFPSALRRPHPRRAHYESSQCRYELPSLTNPMEGRRDNLDTWTLHSRVSPNTQSA